jgi:hypothetical protein
LSDHDRDRVRCLGSLPSHTYLLKIKSRPRTNRLPLHPVRVDVVWSDSRVTVTQRCRQCCTVGEGLAGRTSRSHYCLCPITRCDKSQFLMLANPSLTKTGAVSPQSLLFFAFFSLSLLIFFMHVERMIQARLQLVRGGIGCHLVVVQRQHEIRGPMRRPSSKVALRSQTLRRCLQGHPEV